jgi:hypothetical protein
MRRTLSSIVLVLFTVAVFTPAAMASYAIEHNCCARIQAQQEAEMHCHGMNMPMAPGFTKTTDGMHGMNMGNCGKCCPALTVSSTISKVAKPLPGGIAPMGSDPHPFLTEFAPTQSSQDHSAEISERAPPAKH